QAGREIEAPRRNAENAGVPARNWEHLKLQAFIRRRLEQCQKRVRPFWNLNGLMTANHGHPYGFVVLATDEDAYRLAESKHGIKGSLDQIAQLLQAGTPKWMPGQDRIVLYSREGVAPLFYLDTRELKKMRDSAAEKARDKFLYIDARFEGCVDPIIKPHESADVRNLYAVGMALPLDVVQIDDRAPSTPDTIRVHLPDGARSCASFSQLALEIERDPTVATDLRRQVDELISGLPEEQRSGLQQRANQRVGELLRVAPNEVIDHDDMDYLTAIEQAVSHRMTYGQHLVDSDPSAHA
ncbi:MAG: hypothetical protein ACKOWF_08135, partial [Chloroflexota bacterium]